jgi:hypothetical protein
MAVLALAPLALSSCCYAPVGLEPEDRCTWILTCVELDRSALGNVGSLPIYRREDGQSFGREPVAIGTMQGSSEGLWSINVRFRESVVALTGRTGVHEYDVLTLAGKCAQSGEKIVAQGAIPREVMPGIATEVRIRRISKTKIKLQPASRGQPLPYVFTFDTTPAQARPVSVPML